MELLFDDKWIDHTAGVRRALGHPRKEAAPVLKADQPWETENIHGYHAVFFDHEEKKFKMWYKAVALSETVVRPQQEVGVESSEQGQPERQHFLCYAESVDGLSWIKPDLGIYEFQGSKQNNILQTVGHASVVFGNIQKDPYDPDPAKRYKAFEFEHNPTSRLPLRGTDSHGICVAYSPDGLHWPTGPRLVMSTTEMTDADMLFPGRDPHTGKWVAFMRPRLHPKRRFIGYAESDDFEHWSYPRMLITPDANDSEYLEFYGLTASYVEPFYVGILWAFHNHPAYSPMTNELVFSRDGQHYTRVMPGVQFLPLGGAGSFDSRIITSKGIVHRGDELFIYYNGASHDHGSDRWQQMPPGRTAPGEVSTNAIGLARLSKGMFCGYRADFEGMVETKYVTNYGGPGPLVLAQIDQDGDLKAEILDHYGRVLPGWEREKCRTISNGDGTFSFSWGTQQLPGRLDDESPEGGKIQRVIKLRLYLRRAQIFGFKVGE
ncbi:MAG: hypothetical protein EXR62_15105 [Chloroflexi bacterium]|nr:hypothetical protein [Chloroflexota bacterium]